MQNYRLSSAGFAAQPGRSRFKARRITWCPSRLDEQRQRPMPSFPTLRCNQSSEGGEKHQPSRVGEKTSSAVCCSGAGRRNRLPKAFHICHPPSGWLSGEALCPLEAAQDEASAPLQPPGTAPCAAPPPLPSRPPLAGTQHPTELTRSPSGPLPPGLSELGQGEGICVPGEGNSRRHRRREGGGDGGFPRPQRVTSPIPPPIPDFIYK